VLKPSDTVGWVYGMCTAHPIFALMFCTYEDHPRADVILLSPGDGDHHSGCGVIWHNGRRPAKPLLLGPFKEVGR